MKKPTLSQALVLAWHIIGVKMVQYRKSDRGPNPVAHQQGLFGNVYQNDSLKFWAQHGLDYEKVREFVGLSNTDLSRVARVAKTSVRFDDRIPPELKERMEQIANCCLIVAEHFRGDAQKTATWFGAPNPLLGNISPRDMIRFGRFAKLQRFILAALSGGSPGGAKAK